MKAIINPFIFSQINLDSAELTMLTSVIHKIAESGNYDGTIHRGADIVGRFRLAVSDMPPEKCATESNNQVNIDLKSLDLPAADQIESQSKNCFQVRIGGYVVYFTFQTAQEDTQLNLKKQAAKAEEKLFLTAENSGKKTSLLQLRSDQANTALLTLKLRLKQSWLLLIPKSAKYPNNLRPQKLNAVKKK